MTGVAHLAGPVVEFNGEGGSVILRQRCSWCGTTLIDEDLSRVAVPVGQEGSYPTWAVGSFVETYSPDHQGGVWSAVEWEHPAPVPANACLRMPPEVTS